MRVECGIYEGELKAAVIPHQPVSGVSILLGNEIFQELNLDVLIFDYLGSPYDEESDPLNSGEIILDADGYRMTISVQAVTGYLTIN